MRRKSKWMRKKKRRRKRGRSKFFCPTLRMGTKTFLPSTRRRRMRTWRVKPGSTASRT